MHKLPQHFTQSIHRFVCAVRLTSPYKCCIHKYKFLFLCFRRFQARFAFLYVCVVLWDGWITTIILRDPSLLPIPPEAFRRRFASPRAKVGTPTNSENARRRRQCSSFKAFHFAIPPAVLLANAASVCLNLHSPRDRFCPHFQQIVRLRRNL